MNKSTFFTGQPIWFSGWSSGWCNTNQLSPTSYHKQGRGKCFLYGDTDHMKCVWYGDNTDQRGKSPGTLITPTRGWKY